MRDKLDVSSLNFDSLILARDVKLTIPKFQRSYCWESDQLEMLFEDIESLYPKLSTNGSSGEETKFLGAIIFSRVTGSSGNRFENFHVIDGQQRLLTLYVLLCCAVRMAFDRASLLLKSEGIKAESEKAAKELKSSAVMYAKGMVASRGEDENKSKIVPSFNDQLEFDDALDELSFLEPTPEKYDLLGAELGGALEMAIKFIKERIGEGLQDSTKGLDGEEQLAEECAWLNRLLEIITDRLEFIEVILADRHDPNQVFDRLNVQGQELTVLDLVRNEIFRVFSDDDVAASSFYKKHWLKFEEHLISPLADFRDSESVEQYRKKQTEHKANFWYPYALTIDPDVTANPKKVFSVLRAYWENIKGNPTSKAKKILENLNRYVSVYNAITYGTRPSNISHTSSLWLKIARISEYDIQRSAYGYLFHLLDWAFTHDGEDIEKICQCLDLVESYVMRRALCSDDGSIKNVFNPAWRVANFDPILLQYQLDDNSRPFYDDDTLVSSMTSDDSNFYRLGKRGRFFMAEREKALSADPYEPVSPQLDHIMPQALTEAWGDIDEIEHDKYVNSVGNIVLLTHISNGKKSNKSWQEAVEVYKGSGTREPRDLAIKPNWDIGEIKLRSAKLAEWAKEHWPKPDIGDRNQVNARMRQKLKEHQDEIASQFTQAGINCGFIRKTKTGANKGSITADIELQEFLVKSGIHNYGSQAVGQVYKVQKPAVFFTNTTWEETNITFNRVGSSGAPESRIWPLRINSYCPQWSVLAILPHQGKILLVNCSNPILLEEFVKSYT